MNDVYFSPEVCNMNCPNCNEPVKETEKFCHHCGFPLKSAEPEAAYPATEQPETQQFPYQPEAQPEVQSETQSEAQPTKKSKLPVIIIISVTAAAVIAAGVFFAIWFFGGRRTRNHASG